MAVKYWLETAPEIVIFPDGNPVAFSTTGGQPVSLHCASTPAQRSLCQLGMSTFSLHLILYCMLHSSVY